MSKRVMNQVIIKNKATKQPTILLPKLFFVFKKDIIISLQCFVQALYIIKPKKINVNKSQPPSKPAPYI